MFTTSLELQYQSEIIHQGGSEAETRPMWRFMELFYVLGHREGDSG